MDEVPVGGDILRATSWDAYIGQPDLKKRLDVQIRAAKTSGRVLPHNLLIGPSGYGKTTIANIIADQVGDPFLSITAPVKLRTLAHMLREFVYGVLFIDEIHRYTPAEQEDLLPLLADGYLEINSRKIFANLTVIGASTEPQRIIKPLWGRFDYKPRFVDYTDEEMGLIVAGMGKKIGLHIRKGTAEKLGVATGGTPRVARALVLAARDLFGDDATITDEQFPDILWQAGMDPDGLEENHLAYLQVVAGLGGQAGLKNIVSMLGLPQSIVEELERLLLKKKYLLLEPTGRQLTTAGFQKAQGLTVAVGRRRVD